MSPNYQVCRPPSSKNLTDFCHRTWMEMAEANRRSRGAWGACWRSVCQGAAKKTQGVPICSYSTTKIAREFCWNFRAPNTHPKKVGAHYHDKLRIQNISRIPVPDVGGRKLEMTTTWNSKSNCSVTIGSQWWTLIDSQNRKRCDSNHPRSRSFAMSFSKGPVGRGHSVSFGS